MHQRGCQVISGLNNELCEDLEEKIQQNNTELSTDNDVNTNLNIVENEKVPVLKEGINLPKKDWKWATANDYFKSALFVNGPIESQDLNTSIQTLYKYTNIYFIQTLLHYYIHFILYTNIYFTMSECLNYFCKTLAAVHPTKLFPLQVGFLNYLIVKFHLTLTHQTINKPHL